MPTVSKDKNCPFLKCQIFGGFYKPLILLVFMTAKNLFALARGMQYILARSKIKKKKTKTKKQNNKKKGEKNNDKLILQQFVCYHRIVKCQSQYMDIALEQ